MEVITELSSRAVHKYEELKEDCERYKMEYKRIEEERDEAIRKLKEFQSVSHMVIEEVSAIQENLEIEKSCRQSAEVLASKLHRQNRSLKRKSMQLLAHLGPEIIAEISLEDKEDEDKEEDEGQDGAPCSSGHCKKIITELQNRLQSTLEMKTQTAVQLEVVREALWEAREELLKEKHHNAILNGKTLQQKELLDKYNRVSMLAVEEYEVLQGSLLLEKNLREEAESFAREMLVEQKKLNRQSLILLKSTTPSEALQEALLEVARLTQTLEKERMEHQQQMKAVQNITPSAEQKEASALFRQLQLLGEEKAEWEQRSLQAEEQAKDLRFRVEELQKKLQAAINPIPTVAPPPPPPPPPPPLPPPPGTAPSNPLSSLLSLLRKKKQTSDEIPLVVQDSAKMEAEKKEPDIRQQAVEEMMQRIKKGIQLRPVLQGSRSSRQPEAHNMPSPSAVQELKGILNSFRRASLVPCAAGIRVGSTQSELERALQRRRQAVDSTQENPCITQMAPEFQRGSLHKPFKRRDS